MARARPASPEKPLHWIGSAKKDFLEFPAPVKSEMGYALGLAQLGGKHPNAKPWTGEGPGVLEIVEDYRGDTTAPSTRCDLPTTFMSCTLSRRNPSVASRHRRKT